jgi:hypothetical protein
VRAAALVLSLALVAGCALNEGSALAADFEADWADTADVEAIDTTGYNTLPFAGSATGTLFLEDGTSADRVAELAGELSEYVAGNDGITGEIDADGITFTVSADEALTGEVAALWQSLAEDDRVTGGAIEFAFGDDRLGVEIRAVDAAGAMAVFEEMVADADPYQAISSVTSLDISSGQAVEPWLSIATGVGGEVPADAIAAYEAVSAEYPVVGAGLRTDGAHIVVGEGVDLALAGELARSAAPDLAGLEVTSDSD